MSLLCLNPNLIPFFRSNSLSRRIPRSLVILAESRREPPDFPFSIIQTTKPNPNIPTNTTKASSPAEPPLEQAPKQKMERRRQSRNQMAEVFISSVSPAIVPDPSSLEIPFVETHDIQSFFLVDQPGAVRGARNDQLFGGYSEGIKVF